MTKVTKVSPSILSADFGNLERDIRAMVPAKADYVHVDVMDGIFVPNITIGQPVVASIRKVTELPLDVHLMIDRPIRYVEQFCKAGADILTIHVEADTAENTRKALEIIQGCGVTPAISIKPKTPAESVLPFLDLCGLILVMTVEPGFGGKKLIPDTLSTVRQVKDMAAFMKAPIDIQVDGGITPENAHLAVEAGANVLVAGSAIFRAEDVKEAVRRFKELA